MRAKRIVQNVKVNRREQNTTKFLEEEGKRDEAKEKKIEWGRRAKMKK